MYHLINEHICLILDHLEIRAVEEYGWLVEQLEGRNVAVDREYRRRYNSYWVVRQRPEDWYARYYELLEQNKQGQNVNLLDVCESLYQIPIPPHNRHNIEISFATKLAHMVNQNLPIYDANVKRFFFLPETNRRDNFEQRLERYLQSFNFLIGEYDRVIVEGLLQPSIDAFTYNFGPRHLTHQRIIDMLIWSFVDLAKAGGFQNGPFAQT